ncbi:MAG: chorismate synthase [Candidatus Aminicenantes bacterium]|nr:chorismate synthase [Candidatus Aminicenantes bacterium]
MNSFGRLFRISLFGESHGESIGVVINGCPAGLPLSTKDFSKDLRRRQAGAPGTTQRREPDIPIIKSGLFKSKITGAPLFIMFENKDIQSKKYLSIQDAPRPGHADFVAHHKYGGFNDFRGSGHFSGRLTVGLVAAGVIAKKILAPAVVEASMIEVGGRKEIEKTVQYALKENDSIGDIVECCTKGLPVGLGEPFFDSVESLISHLVFAIPGIKGIEFGSGFACSRMRGSECNDIILNRKGKTKTNHAGGINGGITNGNELVFRVAVKPPSSIKKEQHTINLQTGKPVKITVHGRHDVCIALRMPVIIEAATAVILADLSLIEQKIPRIVK